MNLILKKFLKDPVNIGAVIQSSETSAKKIAKIVNQTKVKNIIEIGGGTGQLAKFIKDKNLTIIDQDKEFYKILKNKYPNSKILNSCGLDYAKKYKKKFGLLASIPLIKSETKTKLVSLINAQIDNKNLEWFILLGYRYEDQFKNLKFKSRKRYLVFQNIPPASIWFYS